MQAVKKYDPERGVKLSSYAAWWIRAYILRYIMDNWKMVKLGTTEAQRKLFFKLRQEQERLLAQGFEATPKLLAERLNVTEQDVVEMDQRLGPRRALARRAGGRGRRRAPAATASCRPARCRPRTSGWATRSCKRLFREKLAEFAKTLEGQGALHLREAAHRRRADDAAGHRRPLRRQPRARPADRGGADRPDARVHARARSRTSTSSPSRSR